MTGFWELSRQYEQESSGSAGDGIIETTGVYSLFGKYSIRDCFAQQLVSR